MVRITTLRTMLPAVVALLSFAVPTFARTIELHKEQIDQAAMISSRLPYVGWVGYPSPHAHQPHIYSPGVYLEPESAFLIRYDLSKIPETMRITKAEWMVRSTNHDPHEARVYVWRMLAPWGPGVCQNHRMTDPEEKDWDKPGGRGPGADRAVNASNIVDFEERGEWITINVTEDVSLWHHGLVPNEGWMLTVEDDNTRVHMPTPLAPADNDWRLRITFEPK